MEAKSAAGDSENFSLKDYAHQYIQMRDTYLEAAKALKMASGPYKASRDAYVAAGVCPGCTRARAHSPPHAHTNPPRNRWACAACGCHAAAQPPDARDRAEPCTLPVCSPSSTSLASIPFTPSCAQPRPTPSRCTTEALASEGARAARTDAAGGGGVMWQRRCRRLMCTCAHGDCAHVLGDIEGGGLLMMFVGACMEVRSCPGRRVATDSDTRGTRVCGGWEAARQQWRTFGACCMCSRACSLRSRGGMASWRGVQDRRCRRPPARDCCCGFGKQNARSKLARPARRRARGLAAVCVECRRRACSLVLPLLPLHLGAGPSPPAAQELHRLSCASFTVSARERKSAPEACQ